MSADGDAARGALIRLVGIGLVTASMVLLVVTLGPRLTEDGAAAPDGPIETASPAAPIAEEAHVFRLRPGDVAVAPDAERRRQAHRRTLAWFRTLRAYPGAPPRIPHGLTSAEFRDTECNVCHERGGWVRRFSAYAPVTPHPELSACLQCHVPDDRVVGITLSSGGAEAPCLQCHAPSRAVPSFAATSWQSAPWPSIGQRAMPGSPPVIPHRLELRGNCLACHMGAAAVEEIRTEHPDRPNCRQCHVPAAEASVFTRESIASAGAPGGER